ncbi:hypothetical protein F400_gp044 [Bacillus phage BCD7]|uniref:Uncharacterized protein n=1 Tax=Bacillus phage BCD7 TaxID=1136534 RepID=J9PUL2_9CAUD|nr:hypothetical protein F400_gp044 [Bacillus phage BCD7]AEZ50491.1 hypothetical protein BCD7_0044 [Bacillus phage BCD7]
MAKIIRDMLEDTLNAEPEVNKFRIVWIKSVTRGPMMHEVEMETEFASPDVIANIFGNIEMEVDSLIDEVQKQTKKDMKETYEHRLINMEDTYKANEKALKAELAEFRQDREKLEEHNKYLLKSNDELVAQIDALKQQMNTLSTDTSTQMLVQHMGEEIGFLRNLIERQGSEPRINITSGKVEHIIK